MKSTQRVALRQPALSRALKIAGLAGAVTLGACASLPPNPELEALQTRYELMSGQTYASQEAQNELNNTRAALDQGRLAYKQRDKDELAHYLVVADKNLDIAAARIELYTTRTQIASAAEVRENVIREARERQLASAQATARAAQSEAERSGATVAAQQQQLALREAALREQQAELNQKDAELAISAAKLAAAEHDAKALADELEEVSMIVNERGTVLILSDIVFDFDSAALKPGSDHALDEVAKFLINQDTASLKVEGHTDALGADDYNQTLSRDRAAAVRNALVARGVSGDRITMAGYGEEYPVASNDSEAGRQLNRRVEIVLDDKVGRPVSTR